MDDEYDDDFYGERHEYCHRCNNTGYVNCYCGGDLCFCENQGETECPKCGEI
jgi:hypothetical protein